MGTVANESIYSHSVPTIHFSAFPSLRSYGASAGPAQLHAMFARSAFSPISILLPSPYHYASSPSNPAATSLADPPPARQGDVNAFSGALGTPPVSSFSLICTSQPVRVLHPISLATPPISSSHPSQLHPDVLQKSSSDEQFVISSKTFIEGTNDHHIIFTFIDEMENKALFYLLSFIASRFINNMQARSVSNQPHTSTRDASDILKYHHKHLLLSSSAPLGSDRCLPDPSCRKPSFKSSIL